MYILVYCIGIYLHTWAYVHNGEASKFITVNQWTDQ